MEIIVAVFNRGIAIERRNHSEKREREDQPVKKRRRNQLNLGGKKSEREMLQHTDQRGANTGIAESSIVLHFPVLAAKQIAFFVKD